MAKKYVYQHKTTTDNRVYYVGCGSEKRPYDKYKNNRSKEWWNIYQSEGLIVEILHITEDEEESLKIESEYIQKYGRICDGGSLVNKALYDSNKGKKLSEETKRKLSEINKGEKSPRFGKKLSEETKQKISESQNKPILQYTKSGEFIKEWPSVTIAAQELNLHGSNIGKCCNGKLKKTGGFVWKYKEEKGLF